MKKLILFISIVSLLLSACSSVDEQNLPKPNEKYRVQLKFSTLEQTVEPMGMGRMTKALSGEGEVMQVICIFTNENDIVVDYVYSYSLANSDFGTINVALEQGKYKVYTIGICIGKGTTDNPNFSQLVTPQIGMRFDDYSILDKMYDAWYFVDTFANVTNISVADIDNNESANYPPIVLERIVGKVTFDVSLSTDAELVGVGQFISDYKLSGKVPHVMKNNLKIRDNWRVDISGSNTIQDIYLFGDIDTSLEFKYFDRKDNTEKTVWVEGVKIRKNCVTSIKGSLADYIRDNSGINILVNIKWLEEIIEEF